MRDKSYLQTIQSVIDSGLGKPLIGDTYALQAHSLYKIGQEGARFLIIKGVKMYQRGECSALVYGSPMRVLDVEIWKM